MLSDLAFFPTVRQRKNQEICGNGSNGQSINGKSHFLSYLSNLESLILTAAPENAHMHAPDCLVVAELVIRSQATRP